MSGRRLGWLAMAAVLVVALWVAITGDRPASTPEERARSLAETVACPTCDGESVADSNAVAAQDIRQVINEQIAAGSSDDEIRDMIAARYGEDQLLTPGRSGLAGLVWILPVVALGAGIAGIGYAFYRWRGTTAGPYRASEADAELVERALREQELTGRGD